MINNNHNNDKSYHHGFVAVPFAQGDRVLGYSGPKSRRAPSLITIIMFTTTNNIIFIVTTIITLITIITTIITSITIITISTIMINIHSITSQAGSQPRPSCHTLSPI